MTSPLGLDERMRAAGMSRLAAFGKVGMLRQTDAIMITASIKLHG